MPALAPRPAVKGHRPRGLTLSRGMWVSSNPQPTTDWLHWGLLQVENPAPHPVPRVQTGLIDGSGGLRLPQAYFMMSLGSFGSGKESLLTS